MNQPRYGTLTTDEKIIMFKKDCSCKTSSSGPRAILKPTGEHLEKMSAIFVKMACDKCDTPWKFDGEQ